MSTTIEPTAAADPEETPAPVDLTKHHDQAVADVEDAAGAGTGETDADAPAGEQAEEADADGEPSLKERAAALVGEGGPVRAHLDRAWKTTGSWLATRDVSDEALVEDLLKQRTVMHKQQETELRRQLARVSSEIIAAKRVETADARTNDDRRDGEQVALLKGRRELLQAQLDEHREALPELLAEAPSEGEVGRARWGRKASRAAALVAGVVGGGIYLPMQDPAWLLAALPAAAVVLWRAGAIPQDDKKGKEKEAAAGAAPSVPGQGAAVGVQVPAADAGWPAPHLAEQALAALAEERRVPVVPGTLPADPMVPPTGTFPIGQVSSPQWAGECIRRALVKEGIPVAEITDVAQQPWGWTCKVRISEGTPAAIIKAAAGLETLMDLEAGRLIATPTRRRALVDLKVAHTDPFAFVPGPVRRAPRSLSLKDRPILGYSMDARPLEMSLYGVQGAVVAGSGGGKSATVRTLAEYLTACRDTVVVALDPSGVGLGPLGGAAALTLTSKEEIEIFLRGMHKVSLKRPELLGKLGMGTEWQPSERWPALVAIADEWPQTTEDSKASGEGVMLTGRKVCAQLLIASQFATAEYIGSAIIPNLSLQILGPCRQADVTATFGGGAIDDGWLAHRLTPKQAEELNDCGRFYLRGGGYNEPVIWRGNYYDDATCLELAAERAAAGIPQLDEESLRMGGEEFAALFEVRGTAARAKRAEADRILAHVAQALRADGLDRARTETLAQMLERHRPTEYGGITAAEVGERLRAAGAGTAVKIGAVDGRTNANGYRLSDLEAALDAAS